MRLICIFLICCSFFWEDDEKEIKSLAQKGEEAIHSKDFKGAKEVYGALFKKTNGERGFLSWHAYIEYYLNYVRSLESLGEFEAATKTLQDLIKQKPPDDYLPRIKLTQARLAADKNSPERAYLEMSKIASYLPMERWTREDLSFFHALCYSLDEHFDTLLKKARRYFVTANFEEARAIYEEILNAICQGYFPKAFLNPELLEKKVRYCLAECHYSMAEYEKTISLINSTGDGEIDREMIYLMALCFQKQQEYEKSIEYFQQYAGYPGQHYDHALFELGIYAYKHGNLSKAKHYFEMLQNIETSGKPKLVGALYLSRILLQEKNAKSVNELLARFSPEKLLEDPLKYERFYLLGEAAFMLNNFEHAKKMYLRSLPKTIGCEWGLQARYKLGWCYVKLQMYEEAEKLFKMLLTSNEQEAALLALARLYLLQNEAIAEEKIEELFADRTFSFEKEHEALLMRAEAALSYEQKRRLYLEATSQDYCGLATYLDAWYGLGLAEFQRGLLNPLDGALYFERATLAFEKAFPLCEKNDTKRASEILKLEAKANFYRNSPLSSLTLLEKLLAQFIETSEEHEETLYLRGLVASKLPNENYLLLAEDSLKQVIELYPNGNYASDALLALGTLYYQQGNFNLAQDTFFKLASKYPHSTRAAEGWFWAAEALDKLGSHGTLVADYRRQLFEIYPTSKYAAEAFFRLYPYSSYVEGNSEAIAHIKQLPTLFANSPLCVTANYLIAMNETDFEKAEKAFQSAIHQFHSSFEEGKIPDITTIHFYYEAKHKLALLYLKENQQIEKALLLLKHIMSDFEEKDHPFASLAHDSQLYDQARYSLAKGYLKVGQKTKAEQIFLKMLTRFREIGLEEGLYLSLTWREQGKLAMECNDLETAMNCLNFSDDAGTYYLSDEQRLNLWLLKSECYRRQYDYSNAMRMLSKVINADVTSPLRIKAMYLRAEIYELQERPELVIRQLEAIVKKGGEWALLAKQKLKKLYGVE